jgi:S-adenosylmethionine synthetase
MYNVIGRPINEPKAVIVQPFIERQLHDAEKNQISEIVENNLQNIHEFCNELISGKYPIV